MTDNKSSRLYTSFAQKLMKRLGNDKVNVVFSPISVFLAMCLATAGAEGDTRREIMNALGGELSDEDLIASAKMIKSFEPEASSANAICVNQSLADKIKEEYTNRVRVFLDSEFFSSNDLVHDVNAWVSEKTAGMIPEILNESSKDALICLVNAVCFQGKWLNPYDDYDVETEEFYNEDGSRSVVQMMYGGFDSSYFENDGVIGFIKPYEGERFSFVAALPKKRGAAALDQVIQSTDFSKLLSEVTYDEVHTAMPKFSFSYDKILNDVIEKMGARVLFTEQADFSGISDFPLMVSKIIHKAHIDVDQNGTKAAAATVIDVVAGCAPSEEYKEVVLNRPFVFAVVENETSIPVFEGVVRKL